MNSKRIISSLIKAIITFVILLIVGLMVYRFCLKAYDFGYRIFSDEPMTPAPGYTMSVAIVEGKSVMEIGEILEEKGLVGSAYLFYLQEMVSDYHGMLKPGVYELSTAMTPQEMMKIMACVDANDAELLSASEDVISEEKQMTVVDSINSGEGTVAPIEAGDMGVNEQEEGEAAAEEGVTE